MDEERDFYNEIRDIIGDWLEQECIKEIEVQILDLLECEKEC